MYPSPDYHYWKLTYPMAEVQRRADERRLAEGARAARRSKDRRAGGPWWAVWRRLG